jgi:cyclohexanecarboxyl-CoA dehydrogenase
MPGADYMGVTAWVEWPDSNRPRITFIRVPANAPGVSCEPMEEMGARGHQLGIVYLRDVRVPVSDVLGGKGAGKELLFARWGVSRCLSALNAIGAAQKVLDETIAFVKRKVVYGKPIGMYQGISFPLIEHYTKIEAARLMAYKGLWMSVVGENPQMQATMTKQYAVTSAVDAVRRGGVSEGPTGGAAAARRDGFAVHRRDYQYHEDHCYQGASGQGVRRHSRRWRWRLTNRRRDRPGTR